MENLLERAAGILEVETLCDRCLGRCFAKRGSGLTNRERGCALRISVAMKHHRTTREPQRCEICWNIFDTVPCWSERARKHAQGYEFERYLFGTRVPPEMESHEGAIWARHGIVAGDAEPLKQEFNREVGKRFDRSLAQEGREINVDFRDPEIAFLIDIEHDRVEMTVKPVLIYGRYRKLQRGIPQTKWPCRHCQGHGCRHCGHTGKRYPTTVEELIAGPVIEATQGASHAFHGAGREDIDALMLGRGRPFVLEIRSPRVRSLDPAALEKAINARAHRNVEVRGLHTVTRSVVAQIKQTEARKSYRVKVILGTPITQQQLGKALENLKGTVEQRTPVRVSHRRADHRRTRSVYDARGELVSGREAWVELVCDGGLYVKELITGDRGRTRPSLSATLGTESEVKELDVLDVVGDFPDMAPTST